MKILTLLYEVMLKGLLYAVGYMERYSILTRTQQYVQYIKITDGNTNKVNLGKNSNIQGRKVKYIVVYHNTDLTNAPDNTPIIPDATFRQLTLNLVNENNAKEVFSVPVIDFNPRFNSGLMLDITGIAPIYESSEFCLPSGVNFPENTCIAIKYIYFDQNYVLRAVDSKGQIKLLHEDTLASSATIRNQIQELVKD